MLRGVVFDLFGTLTGFEADRDRQTEVPTEVLDVPYLELRDVLRATFDERARGRFGDLQATLQRLCEEIDPTAADTPGYPTLEDAHFVAEHRQLCPGRTQLGIKHRDGEPALAIIPGGLRAWAISWRSAWRLFDLGPDAGVSRELRKR